MGLFRAALTPEDKKLVALIKSNFGFKPKNLALYQQALRHKSAATEIEGGIKNSNERLEFLGDSILDSIVADFLFKTYPYKEEGFLTKLRAKIVSRTHLNELAVRLKLDHFLEKNISQSVKHKSLDGNALEAIIGAIYMEKGFQKTKEIILERVFEKWVDLKAIEHTETNFKSRLLEWAQKEKVKVVYRVVSEEDLGYQKIYNIQVEINKTPKGLGKGSSKKEAEQSASEAAWKEIMQEKKLTFVAKKPLHF